MNKMTPIAELYEWIDYRGRRTAKYWKWRACDYFGFPWPNKDAAEDWHRSDARSYTNFRNSETGTSIHFVAEAGAPNPQVLIQIQPFYWGVSVSVGEGYLAWRIGPIAVKFGYGPMSWQKRFKKEITSPWT
jgi:hypothetical protein